MAVIKRSMHPDLRICREALVLADVVSLTDDKVVTGKRRRWIDVKSELYRAHVPCQAVVVIQQERVAVDLWQKVEGRWQHSEFTDADDVLAIACCGLACRVGDLYADSHLAPVPAANPGP